MKRFVDYILAITIGLTFMGCMTTSQWIEAKSQSERNDIFTETTGTKSVVKGYADLEIRASIKTHSEGYFLYEAGNSMHGKQGYPFLLNIDGQTIIWKVNGMEETGPIYNGEGGRNAEGRTGIKYTLYKRLRVVSGAHHLIFCLPGEKYVTELNISLEEGKTYTLEFSPVYKKCKQRRYCQKERLFTNGFEDYKKVILENG